MPVKDTQTYFVRSVNLCELRENYRTPVGQDKTQVCEKTFSFKVTLQQNIEQKSLKCLLLALILAMNRALWRPVKLEESKH